MCFELAIALIVCFVSFVHAEVAGIEGFDGFVATVFVGLQWNDSILLVANPAVQNSKVITNKAFTIKTLPMIC